MTSPSPIIPSDLAKAFRPGLYRHYKGDLYRAWCIGRLSESRHEEMVVYTGIEYGLTWIRPLQMFVETVEVDGVSKPRFERIDD